MNDEHFDSLICGHLHGTLTRDERHELEQRLLHSAADRERFWQEAETHAMLHEVLQTSLGDELTPQSTKAPKVTTWLSWRPLTAAAAGIVFGMLCTSVVFGYLVPALNSSVTLLEEGFEQIEAPRASGVPTTAGVWSGDFAEITRAQQDVTPHSGEKMWRFLRADNAQATTARANYVGEAMQVLELKSLRGAGEMVGGQIEISAWFAQGPAVQESIYHWNIKAAAFQGQVTDAPKLWGKWDDASVCLGGREVQAERSGRWQRVSLVMQIPANADLLVFECAVVQRVPVITQGIAEFPAHFLDDVTVRLLPARQIAHRLD